MRLRCRTVYPDGNAPGMNSSSRPRTASPARNVATAIALIGLFAGSVALFRSVSVRLRSSPLASSGTHSLSAEPIREEVGAPAATDASALPAAIPASYGLPFPPGGVVSSAAAEIELPQPPTGDYEMNLTAGQIDALVEKRYGGLFQSLGLPPGQLARLRALLGERQQATIDAANSALQTGLNPDRDLSVILGAIGQAQAAVDMTLRNELGETILAACRDFDRTLCERNAVRDFARLIAITGEALAPEQQKQLVQILKNSPAQNPQEDMDRAIFGGINTRARISDQAIAEAAAILPPRQVELLRELQRSRVEEDAGRQRSGRQF